MNIDLNSDIGESFGVYRIGDDEALMSHITSANIACGFHGGDPQVIARAVSLAVKNRVAVGAHPSFPDLVGFGRRALDATPNEIENDILYQLGAMSAFTHAAGVPLAHVKAHGALYNLAATNPDIARAIARAIRRFDRQIIFVGLAKSRMVEAGNEMGLVVAQEAFCDRSYLPNGQLQSRREAGAVISDPERAAKQALQIASKRSVTAADGSMIPMQADTLCIHGDTPGATEIARAVRLSLQQAGVNISALGR